MMSLHAARHIARSGTVATTVLCLSSVLVAVGACLSAFLYGFGRPERPTEPCVVVNREPKMQPDWSGVVLPPNIAPLSFVVGEPGARYFACVRAGTGEPIEVFSKTGEVRIPQRPWRRLLNNNRGGALHLDIFVKSRPASQTEGGPGQWQRFARVTSTIAEEDIDRFIVYRRIWPGHSLWRRMGIYQRDLQSYEEQVILDNDSFKQGCVNCHTFCDNRADRMLLGVRSPTYGSSAILVQNKDVRKIGTKFGYSSWHPGGTLVVFSVNRVRQLFHSAANEVRDVVDFDSLIAYYRVDEKAARTASPLARKDWLETYPTWSPDGRYLYFCCAPVTWKDRNTIPERFDQIRYSLVRVAYDVESDRWGDLETVLSAEQTGKSILLPRISPDGRWLLFAMCDYGCFPVYRQSSDLYLMDLEAARRSGQYSYRRLSINSDASESWHSWSSNGRWIAFSSKRLSHVFTRTYLAYVDRDGTVHRPFLLPQKDPCFYDSCLWTFSVPELVAERIPVAAEAVGEAVRGVQQTSVEMPVTMAMPGAGASPIEDESWHQSSSR
ncbi:MAG: PD40 domain-containing protein [Sedimentisphaerales bacterium]|nr:PD40 domain-containing protein [Sedimentisphaerales bacterium]